MEEKRGLLPIMECQVLIGDYGRSPKVENSSSLLNLKMSSLKLLINSNVKNNNCTQAGEIENTLEIKIHITNEGWEDITCGPRLDPILQGVECYK